MPGFPGEKGGEERPTQGKGGFQWRGEKEKKKGRPDNLAATWKESLNIHGKEGEKKRTLRRD